MKNVFIEWHLNLYKAVDNGAHLDVGDWECSGAPIAEAPAIGECRGPRGSFTSTKTKRPASGPPASDATLVVNAPQPEIAPNTLNASDLYWGSFTPKTKLALSRFYLLAHKSECSKATPQGIVYYLDTQWEPPTLKSAGASEPGSNAKDVEGAMADKCAVDLAASIRYTSCGSVSISGSDDPTITISDVEAAGFDCASAVALLKASGAQPPAGYSLCPTFVPEALQSAGDHNELCGPNGTRIAITLGE